MNADAWPVGLPTRLRPVHVLGRGSQGVVWRARDTAAGRDVAVKLVEAPDAERFETEARSLARLRDVRGVVTVLELGRTARGVGWMVSELGERGTLATRGAGAVPALELAAIGVRVAGGLAVAHERGVLHGDITPANVVVRADGSADLVDFAMASLDDPRASLGCAAVPPPGCTPRFAAPERLRGDPPAPASDVYALAATLRWSLAVASARAADEGAEEGAEDAAVAALGGVLDAAGVDAPARRPTVAWVAERCAWVLHGGR